MIYKEDEMGKSGILNAKNARRYATNFKQDIKTKSAKRCAKLVKKKKNNKSRNRGVEAPENLIKSENRYSGD